jgi:hypothetical protein
LAGNSKVLISGKNSIVAGDLNFNFGGKFKSFNIGEKFNCGGKFKFQFWREVQTYKEA